MDEAKQRMSHESPDIAASFSAERFGCFDRIRRLGHRSHRPVENLALERFPSFVGINGIRRFRRTDRRRSNSGQMSPVHDKPIAPAPRPSAGRKGKILNGTNDLALDVSVTIQSRTQVQGVDDEA